MTSQVYVGSSHLQLQHLVENGLSQAFSHMSLMGPLDQLVSVLLVWNNTPAPGDLVTTMVPSIKTGFKKHTAILHAKVTNN